MEELIISQVQAISGRGVAAFFQSESAQSLRPGRVRVELHRPDGSRLMSSASVEYARKVPPGEVIALLFSDLSPDSLPVGTAVRMLEDSEADTSPSAEIADDRFGLTVEVFRTAHELGARHGTNACHYAEQQQAKAASEGRVKEAEFWSQVAAAVRPRG
jgi:hypothetical protein